MRERQGDSGRQNVVQIEPLPSDMILQFGAYSNFFDADMPHDIFFSNKFPYGFKPVADNGGRGAAIKSRELATDQSRSTHITREMFFGYKVGAQDPSNLHRIFHLGEGADIGDRVPDARPELWFYDQRLRYLFENLEKFPVRKEWQAKR